ncbi:MAG: M50 family metallopeptidase [Anaerolineales bacterium]|nr:M50 family metallopeptidase [Anaerolineales bacterium]
MSNYIGQSSEEEGAEAKKKDRQVRRSRWILLLVVAAVVFFDAVYLYGLPPVLAAVGRVTKYLLAQGPGVGTVFLYMVAFIAPIFVFTFVHEMGHAIAGVLVGYRTRLFQVGRFVFRYNNEKWHLRRIGPDEPNIFGGVACTASSYENIVHRTLIMIAGGPIASLLFMFATITLFVVERLWYSALFIIPTGQIVIFTVITAADLILPKLSKPENSDGQNIKVLLAGGAEAFRLAYLHIIAAVSETGVHPRDWDYDLVKQAADGPCQSLQHLLTLDFAYTAALSHQDFDLANAYVDSIQEYVNPDDPKFDPAEFKDLLKSLVYLDVAFFEAFYRDDPVRARRWFEQVPEQEPVQVSKQTLKQITQMPERVAEQKAVKNARARTEAAILLAEGHYQEAVEKAKERISAIEEEKYISGLHLWVVEELETLIAKAEELAGCLIIPT